MWNHRVLAKIYSSGDVEFNIHEVYYDERGEPNGYTENPVSIGGDDIKSLRWQLNKMKECLKKPILYCGDRFPEIYENV